MEKKEFNNDSAFDPDLQEQLNKVVDVTKLIDFSDANTKENFFVSQYLDRRTKPLSSYSLVAVVVEMKFLNMENKVGGKIVSGQVGEICGDPAEPYEVAFIDRPDLNFSEHELFVSLGFSRNDLLLLVENYNDLDNETKSIPKFDLNNEKNLQQEEFPFTSEIEKFLAETAKNISTNLPPHYENNLKSGKLVTNLNQVAFQWVDI